MNYESVYEYAKAKGHKNMCAVIAVALSTKTDYDTVNELMFNLNLRKGPRSCSTWKYYKAAHHLGFDTQRLIVPDHIKTNITLEGKLDKQGFYIIEYRKHVSAYVGGEIEDWSKGRRLRVTGIIRVTKTLQGASKSLPLSSDLFRMKALQPIRL